jgi:uncharacterized protein (TIGR02594 family)
MNDLITRVPREIWMPIALKEENVREIPGEKHEKRILEYHATTSGKFEDDETAWCSSFANWVFLQAGIRGTNSAAARSWLDWGISIPTPEYGCLVVIPRTNDPKKGHVGFYLKQRAGFYCLLGGNQKNMVCREWFAANALSFRWPSMGDVIGQKSFSGVG